MIVENDTNEVVETVPEPKKRRATRRPKVAAESALSTASVKSAKPPRKTRGENSETKEAVVETPKVVKRRAKNGTGKAKAAVQAEPMADLPFAASDEMADLLQLEEENKTLRKALAEKLRSENADLRKRLGQA